jgi:hypothetical protein
VNLQKEPAVIFSYQRIVDLQMQLTIDTWGITPLFQGLVEI